MASIYRWIEPRKSTSLPLGELPKCHTKSLYFSPGKKRQELGISVQIVDASGLVRVPEGQTGRMLGLPNGVAGSPGGG